MRKHFFNLVALTCIQGANAALPLFVFPFALNIVGAQLYSKIVLSEAVSIMVLAFVLYSFEIDGVSRIVGRNLQKDIKEISHTFSVIFWFRIAILGLCLPALLLVIPIFGAQTFRLLLCWLLVPLSYVIQSSWLFQGLEKNGPNAFFTVASRALCIILIVRWIHSPGDYYLLPVTVGGCYFLGSVLTLGYAFSKFGLRLQRIPIADLKSFARDGKEIFLGNLSVLLYRDSNIFILGIVSGNAKAIAAYSIAEKFIKCLQTTMRPLNQLFFPRALRRIQQNNGSRRSVLKEMLRLTIPQLSALAGLILCLSLLYSGFQSRISFLHELPQRTEIAQLVSIMSVAVFFGIANFMLGTVGLNQINERVYYFKAIFTAGLTSVVLCVALVALIDVIGASFSFVIGEVLLFALIIRKYIENPISKFRLAG